MKVLLKFLRFFWSIYRWISQILYYRRSIGILDSLSMATYYNHFLEQILDPNFSKDPDIKTCCYDIYHHIFLGQEFIAAEDRFTMSYIRKNVKKSVPDHKLLPSMVKLTKGKGIGIFDQHFYMADARLNIYQEATLEEIQEMYYNNEYFNIITDQRISVAEFNKLLHTYFCIREDVLCTIRH